MALDLSFAQEMVESLMEDACTITDYGDGLGEREFATSGPTAGQWTEAPGTLVYQGECGWTEQSALANDEQDDGETAAARVRFTGKIPLAAAIPVGSPGLIFEITACGRDPLSIGRKFRVTKFVGGTFKLSRKFTMVEVQPTLAQPADRQANS